MIINHKDIPISFHDYGKGDAVVLLHGFLENQFMWNTIVTQLSKTHRVITIDLLGHGQTECLGYVHTMESMSEVVHEVLTHLKIDSCYLVGHSMGGYVSLAFAEAYSNKVHGIFLMNSTAHPDSNERIKLRDRAKEMAQTSYSNMVMLSISNLFYEMNLERLMDEVEEIKQQALQTPLQGYLAAQEGMKTRPSRIKIAKQHKMFYLIGENDPIIDSTRNLEEAKQVGARYKIVSGGHMSHLENPKELIESIEEFLAN